MIETSASESTGDAALDAALAALHEAIDAVNAADLAALVRIDGPSTGLHAAARIVESAKRKLMAFDSAYVGAVESGDEPRRHASSAGPDRSGRRAA